MLVRLGRVAVCRALLPSAYARACGNGTFSVTSCFCASQEPLLSSHPPHCLPLFGKRAKTPKSCERAPTCLLGNELDVLLGFSCPVKLLTKRPSLVCNGGFFVPESVSFFDSSEIINLYILLLYITPAAFWTFLYF